jgi:integrase
MASVGRRREKNLGLMKGVREIAGRWYWQPPSLRERLERKAQGLNASVPLGKARSVEAHRRYAELVGLRGEDKDGTVGELLTLLDARNAQGRSALTHRPDGTPRAPSTIEQYRSAIPALRARFGGVTYGKTEFEASRGRAIGAVDVQRFIMDAGSIGKRYLAVLDNGFENAILNGRTTYNPCDKAVPPAVAAREREVQEWEVEALRTMASLVMALQMDFEGITGWRVSDILQLMRAQGVPAGVRVRHGKTKKRRLWEWTDEMRRIWRESETLPGATLFPASPVFPRADGRPYTWDAFNREWNELKRATNEVLASGTVDPETLERAAGVQVLDLRFHDLRAKAHDDAEDAGRPGHELLGNTEQVARKHYRRREEKVRPIR